MRKGDGRGEGIRSKTKFTTWAGPIYLQLVFYSCYFDTIFFFHGGVMFFSCYAYIYFIHQNNVYIFDSCVFLKAPFLVETSKFMCVCLCSFTRLTFIFGCVIFNPYRISYI